MEGAVCGHVTAPDRLNLARVTITIPFVVTNVPQPTFRTINAELDAELVVANYRDTSRASYGRDPSDRAIRAYLPWLRTRVEEFPDGHVLAFLGDACVGQLELQVPYGLTCGYVNLFYVTPPFRGRGFGRALHAYAERYFRSWEATRVELHVTKTNRRAVRFYRTLGYRLTGIGRDQWKMSLQLAGAPVT